MPVLAIIENGLRRHVVQSVIQGCPTAIKCCRRSSSCLSSSGLSSGSTKFGLLLAPSHHSCSAHSQWYSSMSGPSMLMVNRWFIILVVRLDLQSDFTLLTQENPRSHDELETGMVNIMLMTFMIFLNRSWFPWCIELIFGTISGRGLLIFLFPKWALTWVHSCCTDSWRHPLRASGTAKCCEICRTSSFPYSASSFLVLGQSLPSKHADGNPTIGATLGQRTNVRLPQHRANAGKF